MNEDLQRQFLLILQSLKEGTSPALQELVRQQQTHSFYRAVTSSVFCLLLLTVCFVCFKRLLATVRKSAPTSEREFMLFALGAATLVSGLGSTFCIGASIESTLDYVSPLVAILH